MHEQSLATSLVRAAERAARAAGAGRVVAVRARVPALSAVSLDHLRHHFALATAGTAVAGAQLEVEAADDAAEVVLESIDVEDEGGG